MCPAVVLSGEFSIASWRICGAAVGAVVVVAGAVVVAVVAVAIGCAVLGGGHCVLKHSRDV